MIRANLWRVGTLLIAFSCVVGCATGVEHEPVSISVPDATLTLEPTPDLPTGVAFTSDRDGDWNIYVMKEDGTDQRRLTNDPARDWAPSWSPDGRHIAFYSYRDGNQDVYVMNADGSDQRNLSQIPTMGPSLDNIVGPPSWSPDGDQIVFGYGYRDERSYRVYEVVVMDADGSNLRNLGYGLSPAWSSDGRSILFICGGYPWWALCRMDAQGSGRREFVSLPHDGLWRGSLAPSPDGRSVVLDYSSGSIYGIHIMGADGSGLRRITDGLVPSPVATGTPDDGSGDDDTDASAPGLPSMRGSTPAWSPDGRSITFSSSSNGNSEIYVMNADGSDQRNLTEHPAMDVHPAWSP